MKVLGLLITVMLLFSCKGKRENSFNPKETESKVTVFLTDYFDDIEKNGLTAEFNYLDTSSSFFWIPPGYDKALNYREVEAAIKSNARAMQSVSNRWEILKVFPLTNEIATYHGVAGTARLMEAGTVIHRANGWKLLSGHTAVLAEQ